LPAPAIELGSTGEYAGVVRVVAFFAICARMLPRALCSAPCVSAKYALVLPPACAMHCTEQHA
jgi:hypothetical protein